MTAVGTDIVVPAMLGTLLFGASSMMIFHRTKTYRIKTKDVDMVAMARCIGPSLAIILVSTIAFVIGISLIIRNSSNYDEAVGLNVTMDVKEYGFVCGTKTFNSYRLVDTTDTHFIIGKIVGQNETIKVAVPKNLCKEKAPE